MSNKIAFKLVFCALLAPLVISSGGLTCERTGDTRLLSLELEVDGVNRLAFETPVHAYDLWLPADATTVTIRAEAYDSEARVNWYAPDGVGGIPGGSIGVGGGEVTVDLPPDGLSLYVGVIAPGGASNTYIVAMNPECPVGYVCDDGNDCTADQCNPPNYMSCQNTVLPDGTSCDFAGGPGECIAGSCEDAPGWGTPDSWVTPEFIGGTGIHLSPSGVAVAASGWVTEPLLPGQPYPIYFQYASHLVPSEGWSDSTRIGGVSPSPYSSYLGIDADGNAMFLWSYIPRTSGVGQVLADRCTPENGWEGLNQVVGGLGPLQHSFSAAMGADGSVIRVSYSHVQPFPRRITASRFTPTGGWGSLGSGIITELSDTASPRVVIGPNGHAIAHWDEGADLRSSFLDLASGWGPSELVGVPTLSSLRVNGSGRALAVWTQDDAGVDTVGAKRYTPAVGWGAAEQFERGDLTTVGPLLVGLDDAGNGLAVWVQSGQVWANTLTASGWDVPQRVDRGGTHIASNVTLDMNPAGEAIAVWSQGEAGVNSIWWTRFTPDVGWRAPKVFEDVGSPSPYNPTMSIAADGTGVILWFRDDMTWTSRFE